MNSRRTTPWAEVTILVLGLLLLGGSMAWNLADEHRRTESSERRRLGDMAKLVDANLSRQLATVNEVLASVQRELPGLLAQRGGVARLNARLASQCLAMPGVRTLFVLDRRGVTLASNRVELRGLDFHARSYFQVALGRNDPSVLQVTPPFQSFLGTYAIDLIRSTASPQGRFEGLVAAVLDPGTFTTLLTSVNYRDDMWSYLAHGDGTLFLLAPPQEVSFGSRLDRPGSFFARHMAGGQAASVFTGTSTLRGQDRLAALRTVRPPALAMDAPLVVGVTRDRAAVFAAWRRSLWIEASLFALVALSSCGGLFVHLKRQRRSAELSAAQDERLRRDEERMRLFFERQLVGMTISSPASGWLKVNDRFCAMLGYTREELRGLRWQELTLPEDLPGDLANYQRLLDGELEAYVHPKRYRRKDGTVLEAELSVGCVRLPGGGIDYIVAVIADQTERLRAEEERRVISEQLLQAQKMESLGVLAGGVAHDMNNVLGAILALATANLPLQAQDSPGRLAFATIAEAAQRGAKVVKSLLSFARTQPAEHMDLDLNALLVEEVALLERVTLSRIKLILDLDPDLRVIRGDGGALVHAIMSLCVNAVDAMPDGGTLTLRSRNLGQDWLALEVADTGAGMSREVLAKAMDPFFTTKEVGRGTGLGLSMVYATVKAHGGRVELESEPGQGTRAVLRFPAAPPAEAAGPPPTHPAWTPGSLQILLVDDDELIQKASGMLIGLLGHVVTPAYTGEEAIGHLEGGLRPDAVILDMNMPGLGGKATLPRLRALCPEAPVLLATGRVDQEALELVAAHPGVTLLPKPYGIEELQSCLRLLGEPAAG